MPRSRLLAILLVLGLVLTTVGGFVVHRVWQDRCGAAVDEVSADDLGPPLDPPGDLGAMVETLDGLPAPFGDVVAGREWKTSFDRPSVGRIDDGAFFLADPGGLVGSEYDGAVVAVDASSAAARWGVAARGYATGGGVVGDRFVTLGIPEDRAPEVASYDLSTGDRESCTQLGPDRETGYDPTLATTQVGDGDVVVVSGDGGEPTVRRLDLDDAGTRWDTSADHPVAEVGSAGGVVVLGSLTPGRSDLDSSLQVGQVRGITALDADDGAPVWTWPDVEPGGDLAVAVTLVDADPRTGSSIVIESRTRAQQDEPTRSLVALDEEGRETWRRPLTSQYCQAARWDDAVVYSCPDSPLMALDARTGAPRWDQPLDVRLVSGVLDLADDHSADLGDGTRLQLANDGLIQIDLSSGELVGRVTEEELGTYVSELEVVGDHLVLGTETGIFLMERSTS